MQPSQVQEAARSKLQGKMVRPYTQTQEGNKIHRRFPHNVEDDELKWHTDAADRRVTIIESNGWKLQMDNMLPVLLDVGSVHTILKDTWHRLHKGNGDLVILIEEF